MEATGLEATATVDGTTTAANSNLALLIVDPQIDFTPGGSCAIPNGDGIAIRIAEFITSRAKDISQIYVSLDSHHRMHISNPCYWQHGDTGEQPPSWTVINNADVENEVWRPCVPSNLPRALAYCGQLEAQGMPSLQIWPEHCLLGTRGSACCKAVNDALQEWAGLHPTVRTLSSLPPLSLLSPPVHSRLSNIVASLRPAS